MPENFYVALLRRMIAVRQKDHECFRGRINPERTARPARVTIGADWENLAARAAERRVNVPAESAPRGNIRRRLHAGHQPDRFRFEKPRSIQLTEIDQHPCVSREISGGREQSGVPRHTAHVPRRRIVNHAAPGFAVHHFRRRNARQLIRRRQKTRVSHFERAENFLFNKNLQRRPAHPLDDFAEQKKIDVAVFENSAGF